MSRISVAMSAQQAGCDANQVSVDVHPEQRRCAAAEGQTETTVACSTPISPATDHRHFDTV